MFYPLKSFLDKTLIHTTWQIKLTAQWPEIMGNLSDKISLQKIHNDTITIGVHEPSWMQELYMLSSVILKTINTHLGSPRIKKIYFKHSAKHTVPTPQLLEQKTFKKKIYILGTREQQALTTIQDDELKKYLVSFLARCKERISS